MVSALTMAMIFRFSTRACFQPGGAGLDIVGVIQ